MCDISILRYLEKLNINTISNTNRRPPPPPSLTRTDRTTENASVRNAVSPLPPLLFERQASPVRGAGGRAGGQRAGQAPAKNKQKTPSGSLRTAEKVLLQLQENL